MRVDRLQLLNFKRFAAQTFEFLRPANVDPSRGTFHVLIGENGVGKTSILDALAVALGVWLERPPDSLLANSHRRLSADQKRLEAVVRGDRTQFQQAPGDLEIRATGTLLERRDLSWGQTLARGSRKVSNRLSREALELVGAAYHQVARGADVLLPVISYYGAGRTWLPHNERRKVKAITNGPSNRWEAFYDCLNDRIRLADLNGWFRAEAIERGNRGGRYRPGFEVVLQAVLSVVPGADGLSYDADREEIVLSLDGNAQPFGNLSAGQRSLFALVADIAIKMVTQNNHLVPPRELGPEDSPLPRVLARTPGVVLIDELDVHLHPKWQRGVTTDLKRIFPRLQFVTTTHSPQVIGGVLPEEIIRLLPQGGYEIPAQSFGMDTNWILQVLMNADEQDAEVKRSVEEIFELIRQRQLDPAQQMIVRLRQRIGNSENLQRAEAMIERIRILHR